MKDDELAVYEGSVPDLFVARKPAIVIKEAREAAMVLVDVVSQKKNKVMMGGEQYLEFEDWQTVAKFYGCTTKVRSTEFIDLGGVKGFLAIADCLDRNGQVLSSAEAMCLNDEEKWSTRTKYRYEDEVDKDGKKIWVAASGGKKGYYKSVKIADGEVSVPLFQLRSMAQTRACAKSLRNVFSWVVVLGGYRPTIAEELSEDQKHEEENRKIQTPQAKAPAETVKAENTEKTVEPDHPSATAGDLARGAAAPQPATGAADTPKTDPEKKAYILAVAEKAAAQFGVSLAQVIFDLSKFKDKDDPNKEVGAQGIDDPRLVGRWLNKTYGEAKKLEENLDKGPF
jgi:hypothetical protein